MHYNFLISTPRIVICTSTYFLYLERNLFPSSLMVSPLCNRERFDSGFFRIFSLMMFHHFSSMYLGCSVPQVSLEPIQDLNKTHFRQIDVCSKAPTRVAVLPNHFISHHLPNIVLRLGGYVVFFFS